MFLTAGVSAQEILYAQDPREVPEILHLWTVNWNYRIQGETCVITGICNPSHRSNMLSSEYEKPQATQGICPLLLSIVCFNILASASWMRTVTADHMKTKSTQNLYQIIFLKLQCHQIIMRWTRKVTVFFRISAHSLKKFFFKKMLKADKSTKNKFY